MPRILVILLFICSTASACVSAPDSYALISPDGTTVLVMLYPSATDDRAPPLALPDGRSINLRATFAKSGSYDASTLAPLWQVDWFAFEWNLRYSSDLRHVARLNMRGMESDWALAFYDNGILSRKYSCRQLLTALKDPSFIPFTSSNWHFMWYDDFSLSLDRSQLVLSTARRRLFLFDRYIDLGLKEFYTFDLGTGEMTSRRIAGRGVMWSYAASATGALALLVFAIQWIRRRMKRCRYRSGFPVGPMR